jgi:hypothetical protein
MEDQYHSVPESLNVSNVEVIVREVVTDFCVFQLRDRSPSLPTIKSGSLFNSNSTPSSLRIIGCGMRDLLLLLPRKREELLHLKACQLHGSPRQMEICLLE